MIPVKIKSNQFDFAKAYAIPLRIQSASSGNISANFGRVLFTVGGKNVWHGTYRHTYKSTLGNGTNTVRLETVDATTVKFVPSLIGVYSNYQALQIDPATNKVTVIMTTPLPIATDPVSNYNPATKTFYLKWTSNGGARQFEETLVLQP